MLVKIEAVKEKLSNYRIEEILGTMANEMLFIPDKKISIQESTGLESTDMQFKYIIGLLLSTKYNPKETEISDMVTEIDSVERFTNEIKLIYRDIKNITDEYLSNFFPKHNEEINEAWKTKRITMIHAFTSYFYQSTLCHEEQIINRIKKWFSTFDDDLTLKFGVDTNTLLEFYNFIKQMLGNTVKNTNSASETLHQFWYDNIGKYSEEEINNMSDEELAILYDRIINNPDNKMIAEKVENAVSAIFKIKKKDVVARFGEEKGLKLINLFSIERGSIDFTYYTEENPIIYKPLIAISEEEFMIINNRLVIDAVYNFLYRSLEDMKGNSFYEKRGKIVEEDVLNNFTRILGNDIRYYTAVCETPKNDEHDILISFNRNLLIVEVKSSKIKEPRRDPESGYDRIKEHYNSKKGIGGGYSQANKLKKKILESETVTLYNEKIQPFEIKRADYDRIFLIVITAEQFGFLNVNSANLLNKSEEDSYFWSCDLYNLENLIDGFIYQDKKNEDFINYIDQRIRYHEKFFVIDELEIAEYFLVKEDFDSNIQFGRAEAITFLPSASNLFDKIKFEERNIPYYYDFAEDCVQPILIFGKGVNKKIGRNEPCPCGSGKKYKKCHGKNL